MLALLTVLLSTPVWEAGATLGPGVVDTRAALLATPWGGLRSGPFEVALQAPLRFEITDTRLRPEDWDEVADAGRVLRFARYGEAIGVGIVSDLTLGHGTIVRRYHGGTDDDTHRVGALVTLEDQAFGGLLFVDQLLGPPVVGARLQAKLWRLTVGGTGVVDSDARDPAYGLDVAVALADHTSLYADGNMLVDAPGVHLGIEGGWASLTARLEGLWGAAGYDPFHFDFGYLIDRHHRPLPEASAFGGRASVEYGEQEALRIGAEYSDAEGPDRAGLVVWLRVPDERVSATALWRTRGRRARLFEPDEALAAAVLRVRITPVWSVGATLARVWREHDGFYQPGTDAALVAEAAFGL